MVRRLQLLTVAGHRPVMGVVGLLGVLALICAACSTTTVIVVHTTSPAVLVIHPDAGSPYGTVKPTALARPNADLRDLAWTQWSATLAVGRGTIAIGERAVPVTLRFAHVIDDQFTSLAETYGETTDTLQGTGYTGSHGGTKTTVPAVSGPILVIHVVFPASTYGVIRPADLAAGPSQTGQIVNLKWSSWNETSAIGHGMEEGDGCLPNCAQGKISYTPVLITLSDPVQGQYTRLILQLSGRTQPSTGQEARDFFEGSAGGVIVPIAAVSSTTTTTEVPTTVTTVPATTTVPAPTTPSTSSSTAPTVSQITLSGLEAAAVRQSGLGAGTTATCGPALTGLGLGSYVACGLFNANVGGAEEVVQITGPLATSFTVVVGPGSDIGCSGLNTGELAAMTAHGSSCDPNN